MSTVSYDHQEYPQQQDLHRSDSLQWGRNEGYSPTDYLDSNVESVQSDVEWEQRIMGQFVEISPNRDLEDYEGS